MRLDPLGLLIVCVLAAPAASAQVTVAHKSTPYIYPALAGINERPTPNASPATARMHFILYGRRLTVSGSFTGLTGAYRASHVHGGTGRESGPILFALRPTLDADGRGGTFAEADNTFTLTDDQLAAYEGCAVYMNVHSETYPDGEIRGQLIGFSINEVLSGPAASFVEILGTPGTDLDGMTLLVIDGDRGADGTGKVGTISRIVPLRGTIPTDGYWFAASPAAAAAYPGAGAPDQTIEDGPLGVGTSTILLVSGFSDGRDNDCDGIDNDCDFNDDGLLDAMPWDGIADALSLVDGGIAATRPDAAYFPVRVGPNGAGAPAGAFRLGNGNGPFALLEATAPARSATPGKANPDRPTATDEAPASGLSLSVGSPLRGTARVRFSAAPGAEAHLALYDVLGRRVATLAEGGGTLGERTATLDAGGLAPGVYVLRLVAGAGVLARTVTVVR